MAACWCCRNKPQLLTFNSRVSVVGVGYIKLERDLPYNVSTAWKPALHIFECERGDLLAESCSAVCPDMSEHVRALTLEGATCVVEVTWQVNINGRMPACMHAWMQAHTASSECWATCGAYTPSSA